MIKELNDFIRRKNYQNFIKGGIDKMSYRISDEVSKNAIQLIEDESLKERLIVLNNQIDFLTGSENSVIENTVFSEEDAKKLKEQLSQNNNSIDVLNFKKDALLVNLDDALSKINIEEVVKTKSELSEINQQLDKLLSSNCEIENKIKSSRNEYDLQMVKIRDKYDDVDITSRGLEDSEFSKTVIVDYKKERATKLANQFLETLTPEKKQQILSENKELNDLVYVGENI